MWPIVFAVDVPPTLLGLAAFITAMGGIGTTIMAIRKARSEEEEHLIEELKKARSEAEVLAAELHKRKMDDEG